MPTNNKPYYLVNETVGAFQVRNMPRKEWIDFKYNADREGKSANQKLIEVIEMYNEIKRGE